MIKDPYAVLGVSRSATPEEIKKAYRKKARENHPDVNHDDPDASKKMNEINEAYDRIVNPEKYRKQDANARRNADPYAGSYTRQGYGNRGYGGPSEGYGGSASGRDGRGYGGYGRTTEERRDQGTQSQDPFGWGTGFGFDDLFGYGAAASSGGEIHPEATITDSAEVRQAISYINAGSYRQAVDLLSMIPSYGRNARWYYLAAIASNGAGSTLTAIDQIKRAVQMEPNNKDYTYAQMVIQHSGQTYQAESRERGFSFGFMNPTLICCTLCTLQYFARYFCF